jgi:hypothetical protein
VNILVASRTHTMMHRSIEINAMCVVVCVQTCRMSVNTYASIHIVRKPDYFSYILRVRVRMGDTAFYVKQDHFHLNYYSVLAAHERLGYSNEDATRAMVKVIGIKFKKRGVGTCLACNLGKAKQKNLKKASDVNKSAVPGGCVYLDISSVKSKKGDPKATKPNWRIMVDESTNMKITHFFKTKNGMCETTCELIKKWKDMKIEVKCLRMDNAGENKLI